MRGKKRPNAERVAAITLAEVSGVEAASKSTGIPERTIYYWLDRPEFADLRTKTREEMRDGFKVLVHKAQERLTALVGEMEPRDLTILLGVATDKTLLMSGEATGRTESTLLRGKSDHEQQLLADVLNRELERRAYADAAGDQAVDPMAQPAPPEPDPAGV